MTRALGRRQAVLLRLTPDVDPHTHSHISTGALDSKFGFALAADQAEAAVRRALAASGLDVIGLHCHIGSQLFEMEPYEQAIDKMLAFAAEMKARYGLQLREFSPGGGFGLQYVRDEAPPSLAVFAGTIASAVKSACELYGLALPRVVVEPGRSLVGRAGLALYEVGARKEVPGVRTYVAVDGGMADNIRPAIYGSRYEALAATRPSAPAEETVTVVGKYCESGDVLIRDVTLPRLEPGDLLAVPASGRLLSGDGKQLQPVAEAGGHLRSGRKGSTRAPSRDLQRPAGLRDRVNSDRAARYGPLRFLRSHRGPPQRLARHRRRPALRRHARGLPV